MDKEMFDREVLARLKEITNILAETNMILDSRLKDIVDEIAKFPREI